MKSKDINKMNDLELMDYFIFVAHKCVPEKLVNINNNRLDQDNINRIEKYRNYVTEYLECIKLLKKRGYTLEEIMSLR